MEKLIRYHLTCIATCPNNGVDIHHDLTIATKVTIMVGDVMAEVRSIAIEFQEDIAHRLVTQFLTSRLQQSRTIEAKAAAQRTTWTANDKCNGITAD